ncbi:MAG: dTMP kinase [Lentisphaerae bacterium]|nr:dTMP kinase [Lentisphaerota bacterium]
MKGFFVTFEGPEGSGKSTQAGLLVERLLGMGIDVVATREPGGTAVGNMIRDIVQHDAAGEPVVPESETLLFGASRAQLVKMVILPALERGSWVVSDRFADSTVAYQGYGRGFDVEQVHAINRFATGGLVPDMTLLLDFDPEMGFNRLRERNQNTLSQNDRIENEQMAFHKAVRDGYLKLAREQRHRIHVLDASGTIEDVHAVVWTYINDVINRRAPAVGNTAGADK